MTVTPMPTISRLLIESVNDVAAVEGLVSAVAGVVAATGGLAALAGRPIFRMEIAERARLLNEMYAEGEVVFGWRHREGAAVNIALDRVSVAAGDRACEGWRALVYEEEAGAHALRGAVIERAITALSPRLIALAGLDRPRGLPSPATAMRGFLSDRS